MKRLSGITGVLILLLVFVEFELFALTATEIIEKSDNATRGQTQIATMELTVKTRRFTRTLTIKSYMQKEGKKSFIEITAPSKDAGNRFLLMDKNMWQYAAKTQDVIKIAPSMMLQSWMGSDFTNDDIVKESSIVADYTHKLAGTEIIDNMKCYKIELTPKPGSAVVWGKIIYYARERDFLPVREELYDQRGNLSKLLVCSDFKKMHDRVIPTHYRMETTGKPDQFTEMVLTDVKFNTTIPGNVFSLQYLKRK